MSHDPKCIDCGRPRSEHHEFRGIDPPEGCKCWNDGSWGVVYIPKVCGTYAASGPKDRVCAVCQHDEACHVTG